MQKNFVTVKIKRRILIFLLILISLTSCVFENESFYYFTNVNFRELQKHSDINKLIFNKYPEYTSSESIPSHELVKGTGFAIVYYIESNDFMGLDRARYEKLTIVFKNRLPNNKGAMVLNNNNSLVFYSNGFSNLDIETTVGFSTDGEVEYEWDKNNYLILNISLNIQLIDLITENSSEINVLLFDKVGLRFKKRT